MAVRRPCLPRLKPRDTDEEDASASAPPLASLYSAEGRDSARAAQARRVARLGVAVAVAKGGAAAATALMHAIVNGAVRKEGRACSPKRDEAGGLVCKLSTTYKIHLSMTRHDDNAERIKRQNMFNRHSPTPLHYDKREGSGLGGARAHSLWHGEAQRVAPVL